MGTGKRRGNELGSSAVPNRRSPKDIFSGESTTSGFRMSKTLLLVLFGFGILNILPWVSSGWHTEVREGGAKLAKKPWNASKPRSQDSGKVIKENRNKNGGNTVEESGTPSLKSSSPQQVGVKLSSRKPKTKPPTTKVPEVKSALEEKSNNAEEESGKSDLAAADPITGEILSLKSDKVVTGEELLQGYDPKRSLRTCDELPDNITVSLSDKEKIGIKQIFVGLDSTSDEFYYNDPKSAKNGDVTKHRKSAYSMMVSNHKYIDGAYVMAESLKKYSSRVQKKEVDVIIIISDKIKSSVVQQLRTVFDRVIVLYSTAIYAPKSYYAPTFDKMYLWWLTWYEKVIFLDADTIATGNPDFLFDKAPPKDRRPHYLTAVGGSSYFQTALMILHPNRELFTDIFLEFRFGLFGYNQWRARDGILLRTCFMPRHQNIGHPSQLHHYYGDIKPWFDKDAHHKRAREKQTFDSYYKLFWDTLEEVHQKNFVPFFKNKGLTPAALEVKNGGGGTAQLKKKGIEAIHRFGESEGVKLPIKQLRERFFLPNDWPIEPENYMWLQRFRKGSEFLRPTVNEYLRIRNWTLPGLRIVTAAEAVASNGGKGENSVWNIPVDHVELKETGSTSCTELCKKMSSLRGDEAEEEYTCDPQVFNFTVVNSCEALNHTVGGRCSKCTDTFETGMQLAGGMSAPYVVQKAVNEGENHDYECKSSALHDPLPTCDTLLPQHSSSRGSGNLFRVCGCVPKSSIGAKPTRL